MAPGLDGTASGSLYLDEGNNLDQPDTSEITFSYANGTFVMGGTFGYDTGNVSITSILLLGGDATANSSTSLKTMSESVPLTGAYSVQLG